MLAFITEKLKNQRIDDPVEQHVCDINLIQGRKINLKSKSKISDRRSRKTSCGSQHKAATGRGGPTAITTSDRQQSDQQPTTPTDTPTTPDPPNKKQCLLSHHSVWLPWTSDQSSWQLYNTQLQHSTFGTLHPINSPRSFNFSTPDIGHAGRKDVMTESPTPRPASASSGFCDSTFSPSLSSSDTKSLGVPWSFHFRSLSLEERLPTPTAGRRFSYAVSSPVRRSHIPRSHSQPCVMDDRKCGVKRRRDYDRPTLNFDKMTETAYTGVERRTNTSRTRHKSACSWSSRFKEELLPIASSPLDHDVPLRSFISPGTSPIKTSSDSLLIGFSGFSTLSGFDGCTDSGCSDMDDRDIQSLSAADTGCHDNTDTEVDDEDMNSTHVFTMNDLDVAEIERH